MILVRPATLNEPPGGFEPLLESEEEPEGIVAVDSKGADSEPSGKCFEMKNTLTKFLAGVVVSFYQICGFSSSFCTKLILNVKQDSVFGHKLE